MPKVSATHADQNGRLFAEVHPGIFVSENGPAITDAVAVKYGVVLTEGAGDSFEIPDSVARDADRKQAATMIWRDKLPTRKK